MLVRTPLDRWEFRQIENPLGYPQSQIGKFDWQPAQVPGSVHLDLARAGVIPDPFGRSYEAGLAWVDQARWEYRTTFEWTARGDAPTRVLRFAGLDTVCTVFLNDSEIARHDNMFTPLEVNVTDLLKLGENRLQVIFESAVVMGQERRAQYFESEGIRTDMPLFDERAFVRKAAYMSGWDWGPRLVSAGIWRPVDLLEYESRISQTSVHQERLESGQFRVWIEVEVEGKAGVGAEFNGEVRQPGETLEFLVDSPKLWWPNGEGDAHLYDVRIFLSDGQEVRKKLGLRTIRLVRETDALGKSFGFEVNGRSIWSRGANWIPNDSFVGRSTEGEISSQINACRMLGMNMLRVWGGGFYESEDFYDACDREGVLVWQDFPFACSYYPDGPCEQAVMRKEAGYQIRRLRDRTCLALWCGNNENSAMYEGAWGGKENLPARYFGENIYNDTLPKILGELDPGRDYIPSSPLHPLDETLSDAHYWDVWHGRGDWKFYEESKTRFSSEFGFASSCSPDCWRAVLEPQDWEERSTAVRWHDKTNKPVDTFEGYVLLHYPQWANLDEWIYYSQLNQRDALRCGIEHYRRSEFCRGALIWQFNDCWPVQSWAVQDYARLHKAAAYELARIYAPEMLSIHLEEGKASVHVVNDRPRELQTTLVVSAISTIDGTTRRNWTSEVCLEPNRRESILDIPVGEYVAEETVLKASLTAIEGSTTWRLLAEPKATRFGNPRLTLVPGEDLIVRVEGFVHDLMIWDEVDAFALVDPLTGLSGFRAISAANEDIRLCRGKPVTRPVARSLAGIHPLH